MTLDNKYGYTRLTSSKYKGMCIKSVHSPKTLGCTTVHKIICVFLRKSKYILCITFIKFADIMNIFIIMIYVEIKEVRSNCIIQIIFVIFGQIFVYSVERARTIERHFFIVTI